MSGAGAKSYSRIRYTLSLVETAYLLILLAVFSRAGWSAALARAVSGGTIAPFFTLAAYVCVTYTLYYAVSFPLTFYRSFLLEHRFSLSTQGLKSWFMDQAKSGMVVYAVSLVLFSAFYWSFGAFPAAWWLAVSFFWLIANVVLARIAPAVIVPLFFKYKPLSDDELRSRVTELARKLRVDVTGVFEIDMSVKTTKANAGLIGWGKSRRVILGDTLRAKYTPDEIEVILAHEFAHQKLRHVQLLMAGNAIVATACFYLIAVSSPFMLSALGLLSLGDVASLPLVIMYFVLFGICTQPVLNFCSRKMERDADIMALEATGLTEAFVSAMEKLCSQNLAERDPGPVVKWFFFDHPPIGERIAYARAYRRG